MEAKQRGRNGGGGSLSGGASTGAAATGSVGGAAARLPGRGGRAAAAPRSAGSSCFRVNTARASWTGMPTCRAIITAASRHSTTLRLNLHERHNCMVFSSTLGLAIKCIAWSLLAAQQGCVY